MKFYSNIKPFLFILSLAISFTSLSSCADDDDASQGAETLSEDGFFVSVTGNAEIPNTLEKINLSSSFNLFENTSDLILGGFNSPLENISSSYTGVGLSESDSAFEENGLFRIGLILCGDTTINKLNLILTEMLDALNSNNENGFVLLEMFYNEEIYMNLNLESHFSFSIIPQSGCGVFAEADDQAEVEFSFEEARLHSELLFAPAQYSYTGYLYNFNKRDSIFLDDVEVNFPLIGF